MDLHTLADWNTHWTGGPVSELVRKHPRARAAVELMVEELLDPAEDQWSLRPGPRQIGKTTSLGHVAAALVERGVDPKRVAIIPLDQEPTQKGAGASLEEIIQACFLLAQATRDEPLFLLLDEIQELPDWDMQMKTAWDRLHDRVRVVATGSSALRMLRSTKASFPGRVRVTRMFPMKFREVVEAHPERTGLVDEAGWSRIRAQAKAARDALLGPVPEAADALRELHLEIAARRGLADLLRRTFLEYCVWGGYPRARPGSPMKAATRIDFFDATWNSIVAKDLPHAGVVKVRDFRSLFGHFARSTGGKFVRESVASKLGISVDSAASWKQALEDLLLVQQLSPLKPNLALDRGRDKVYLVDPGWYAYWENVTDPMRLYGRPEMGALMETVLVDHMRRLRFNLFHTTAGAIGYVQRPEVDIAARLGPRWLLVEVKGRGTPRGRLREVGGTDDIRILAGGDHLDLADPGGVWTVPAHELALVC